MKVLIDGIYKARNDKDARIRNNRFSIISSFLESAISNEDTIGHEIKKKKEYNIKRARRIICF